MSRLGRRRFLARGSLTAVGLTLPFAALWSRRSIAGGWGALVSDPAGILDLPRGFTYRILETAGQAMDDGYVVPGKPDGMACFSGTAGTVVVMRNHEVELGDSSRGAYGPDDVPPEAYDEDGFGGVTRIVLDANDFTRISSNLVLTGTVRNCAGGPSPWGWLSCEETVDREHGYVFVCPPDATRVAMPQRIDGYGRFRHEAAAVDPDTLCCYLTEDRGDGCLYRFVPHDPADPFTGTLQAMRVVDQPNASTSVGHSVGEILSVEWVDLTDPTPPEGDTLRVEAAGLGAATISRGEGIWYFEGSIYISSTNGGPSGLGQIFQLIDGPEGGTLELIAQSEATAVLDFPDNITVAPWGQLFLAEDGGGAQLIRALTEDGQVVPFARNALSNSEMAGVCFSPDGRALFLNIQHDGLTLVVTGPFVGNVGAEGAGSGSDGSADPQGSVGTAGGEPSSSADDDHGPGERDDDGATPGCGCSSGGPETAEAAVLVGVTGLGLGLGLRPRGPTEPGSDD